MAFSGGLLIIYYWTQAKRIGNQAFWCPTRVQSRINGHQNLYAWSRLTSCSIKSISVCWWYWLSYFKLEIWGSCILGKTQTTWLTKSNVMTFLRSLSAYIVCYRNVQKYMEATKLRYIDNEDHFHRKWCYGPAVKYIRSTLSSSFHRNIVYNMQLMNIVIYQPIPRDYEAVTLR